jgi:isopenicillin N synthase-like dioxygenase
MHRNVYRGWFPLQNGAETYKEGIDIGPDIAHGAADGRSGDPLKRGDAAAAGRNLPGWRAEAAPISWHGTRRRRR